MAEFVLDPVVEHGKRVAGMNFALEIDVVAEGTDHFGENAGRDAGPVCRGGQASADRAATEGRHLAGRAVLVLDDKAACVVARHDNVAIRRQREPETQQPIGLRQHRGALPRPQIARIPYGGQKPRRLARILRADADPG